MPELAASQQGIVVREPHSADEVEALHRATARVFNDAEDEAALAAGAARWRADAEGAMAHHPVHLRAAFRGDTFAGSDVIYERQLRLGARGEARLATACIAVVLAHPDHRMQGVGRALMRDNIRLARERELPLLLLDGIHDFYHRYGYVNALSDLSEWRIERRFVRELPHDAAVSVRPAQEGDAQALLDLYERHYGAQPGGFTRTVDQQRQRLLRRLEHQQYHLALDATGRPVGYIKFRRVGRHRVHEAAADTWAAAATLLRYQEQLLQASPHLTASGAGAASTAAAEPEHLTWFGRPGSRLHYVLAGGIRLESEVRTRPRTGWQARPAHLPALFRALRPALLNRWRRHGTGWQGALTIDIAGDPATDQDGGCFSLTLGEGSLRVTPAHDHSLADGTVRLRPGAFTELLFGYRPVWWVAGQPGNHIPARLAPVMETLFPPEPAFVAPTDEF